MPPHRGPAAVIGDAAARQSLQFFGFLVGLILVMLVIGQKLALPLFVVVYMLWWSEFGWRLIGIYGLLTWAALIVFYNQVLHVFWYPAALSDWLSTVLPAWLPPWLFV